MDVRAALAHRVFVPFYERRWGLDCGDLLAELRQSERDDPEVIRGRQLEALRETVRFAAASVPHYGQSFAATGFDPSDLNSFEDFARLPLLKKDDIRGDSDALIGEGLEREQLFHKRTGGSTGVPVHVYWDQNSHRFKRAVVKRHDAWAGYRLGCRQAALWGDTDKRYPLKERIFKALCERTTYLDTLKMNRETMRAFVRTLRRTRPRTLIGHAHSIFFFTEFLLEDGADDIEFSAIISTAETLEPSERALIEGRFGRVVFDRYGCEEVSLIASECEAHDGLHQSAESLYVEVLGGDATTPGRVVVTDLINRGMPLIRYEVGDLATVVEGRCSCGRGLPRLGRVFGRTTDILYAPDGRKISGVSILDTFVIHIPGVRQAQIVQDALDHIQLRVVADSGFDESTRQHVTRVVAEVFGSAMNHTVVLVDSIEPTARGKFQFTVCEIEADGSPRRVVDRSDQAVRP